MSRPKISILIPVYRGQEFLEVLVKLAIQEIKVSYEILISIDNAGMSHLDPISNTFLKNNFVKVFYQDEQLGMNRNYEFLISKATGEWVTIVGQDDLIIGKVLNRIFIPGANNTLNLFGVDIISGLRSYFYWHRDKKFSVRYSFLRIPKKNRITKNMFYKICYILGFKSFIELPFLYTGNIYRKVFLDQLIQYNSGIVFSFPVPDVSSSALTNASDYKVLKLKFPFSIVGTSNKSTGKEIQSLSAKNDGNIIKKHFDFMDNENFTNRNFAFDKNVLYEYPSQKFYQYLAVLCHSSINQNFVKILTDKIWFFDWIAGQTVVETGFYKSIKFWLKYKKNIHYSLLIFVLSVTFAVIWELFNKIFKIFFFVISAPLKKSFLKIRWANDEIDLDDFVNKIS